MANKRKFNPRQMMEKAIEAMRRSVGESRDDGKPNPLVGAVLVRPDGSTEFASRGELRAGNHAEFTLLERKCIGEKLDDCVLFATLEPCLNRNHPKRGCARHIVSARIKKVYVGIEDDNPTVAGKGIQYLRDHGVEIEMFDRDLQAIILKENRTFFEWARKQTDKPEEKPIQLSPYENAIAEAEITDFSQAALKRYRSNASIESAVGSTEFNRILKKQGLLIEEKGELLPSGFGYLLFGKDPRLPMPQAGLLARAEFPDGTAERKEFSQAMVLIPGELEKWLNKILPHTLDRGQMERIERVDLPFEMIREAVVNALIHRDYDIKGQKCQLVISASTITIKSPGDPIPPITMEEMRSFSAPMKSRNPILHFVFARMGMAEEQGYGLQSLKQQAAKLGLPLPSYSKEGDSLVLTIYRTVKAVTANLAKDVRESLSEAEVKGWEFIMSRTGTTQSEYAKELEITARTAQRHLTHFVELGLLSRIGKGPATEYRKP
jgi:ATP-dependent DNA helicase RecG